MVKKTFWLVWMQLVSHDLLSTIQILSPVGGGFTLIKMGTLNQAAIVSRAYLIFTQGT